MNSILIILTLLSTMLLIHSSYQVKLECEYQYRGIDFSYICVPKNIKTSWNDKTVTEVVGSHLEGKNNSHVDSLVIHNQNCHFIPRNLGQFFPNLENLIIMKSNVQFLLSGDLDGLNKLQYFDVSNNPIEHIGEDFFTGHTSITSVSFSNCHIKKVDFGALDSLKKLTSINFEHNECIDIREEYVNKKTIERLSMLIYSKCHGKGNAIKTINFRECAGNHPNSLSGSSGSATNYILLPLGILSFLLTLLLGFIIFRVYRSKSDGKFNEVINDGFDEYEAN